ncbi:MAG: hypothetical protein ABFS03_04010 [Chloroflexota bacterium]
MTPTTLMLVSFFLSSLFVAILFSSLIFWHDCGRGWFDGYSISFGWDKLGFFLRISQTHFRVSLVFGNRGKYFERGTLTRRK